MIKRLDGAGRLMLIERDVQGRVVRITGFTGPMTGARAQGPILQPAAWIHCFAFDTTGKLAQEIDCTGQQHSGLELNDRAPDLRRGTAIQSHAHVGKNE